jgi:hypothetical protein
VPRTLTQECWVTVSHTYTGVLGESPANLPQGAGKGAIVSSVYLGCWMCVLPCQLPNYLRVMPRPILPVLAVAVLGQYPDHLPQSVAAPPIYLRVLGKFLSQFTWGCFVSAPPTAATFSRLQGTTLRTPGGRPAS